MGYGAGVLLNYSLGLDGDLLLSHGEMSGSRFPLNV